MRALQRLRRDVLDEAFEHALTALVGHRAAALAHPLAAAVLAVDAVLDAVDPLRSYRRRYRRAHAGAIFGLGDRLIGHRAVEQQLIDRVAGERTAPGADEAHGPVRIDGTAEHHAVEIAHQHVEHATAVDSGPRLAHALIASRQASRRIHILPSPCIASRTAIFRPSRRTSSQACASGQNAPAARPRLRSARTVIARGAQRSAPGRGALATRG